MEHETLEADVVIVGAGPAGLSCAIRLAQLARDYASKTSRAPALAPENVYVLEKGSEIGAHSLSGAVLDPRALRELFPAFASLGAPLESTVTRDRVLYLTERRAFPAPITPPFLRNHGNYVISLNKFTQWLGKQAEGAGVSLFPGFAGMEVLYEGARVAGVRTDDKGIGKDGNPKANFQPGVDIRAKVTVFAEGTRGSLTQQVVKHHELDKGRNAQAYSIGVKELWEVPAGRIRTGEVFHTAGWPLRSRQFGGGFVYGLSETRLSIGLVVALANEDPRFDAHNAFQQWKTHPWLRRLLEGSQIVRYGAKTLPEGGYYAIPTAALDGGLIVGDAGGFLNAQRLKGIHLAMKTGMLAAETIFQALGSADTSHTALSEYERRWQGSWVKEELWRVRNYRQGFENGFMGGVAHACLQELTGGRGLHARYCSRPDPEHMKFLSELKDPPPTSVRPDGRLTFDKLKDVFYSGTHHEENQPSHLRIGDWDLCNDRCAREYGNPCQYYCPASVYEMEENPDGSGKRLKLNPSNCVHCKTCDIADPYGNILWVCPEGGGGPRYEGM